MYYTNVYIAPVARIWILLYVYTVASYLTHAHTLGSSKQEGKHHVCSTYTSTTTRMMSFFFLSGWFYLAFHLQ